MKNPNTAATIVPKKTNTATAPFPFATCIFNSSTFFLSASMLLINKDILSAHIFSCEDNLIPNEVLTKFLGVNALTDCPVGRYYGPVEKITNFMDKLFQGNKVKKINTRIPKDIKMKIKTRFSSSNKKLDSEFKLSLKKYDYFYPKMHL